MGDSGLQRMGGGPTRTRETTPRPREAAHPYKHQQQHQQREEKGKQPEVEPVPPRPPRMITTPWEPPEPTDILYHKAMHERNLSSHHLPLTFAKLERLTRTPPLPPHLVLTGPTLGSSCIEVQALMEYNLKDIRAGPLRYLIEFKTSDLDRWAETVSRDRSNQKLGVVVFKNEKKYKEMYVVQQNVAHVGENKFLLEQFRVMVNGRRLQLERGPGARLQFMFALDLLDALDPTLETTTMEVVPPQNFRRGMLAIMYMRNEWTDNPPLVDRILPIEKTNKHLEFLIQEHIATDKSRHQQKQTNEALRKAQKKSQQAASATQPAASLNGDRARHDGPATGPSQQAASAIQPAASLNGDRHDGPANAPSQQAASATQPAASLNGDRSRHDGPANAPSQQAASATQPSPHPPPPPSHPTTGITTPTPTPTPTPANEPVSNDDHEDTDPDVEAIEKEIVSFKCPISLLRIERPVRGQRCMHRQCFDFVTFRTINGNGKNRKAKWMCPPPTDEFFFSLLRTYPNASRCVILAGGQHEALEDSFGGDVGSSDDDDVITVDDE
ncbi:hypothetical protein HK104_005140 [Borealophlyctis nickersoniae]|nr:hypothetical protein HK104_005140 [Borealophlyctis nickersoniae]